MVGEYGPCFHRACLKYIFELIIFYFTFTHVISVNLNLELYLSVCTADIINKHSVNAIRERSFTPAFVPENIPLTLLTCHDLFVEGLSQEQRFGTATLFQMTIRMPFSKYKYM